LCLCLSVCLSLCIDEYFAMYYVRALDLHTHQVARWKEHRVVEDSVAQSLYAAEKVYTRHTLTDSSSKPLRC
jgi:hypothetical protein